MRCDLNNHVKIHEKAVIDPQPLVITVQERQHSTDNVPTTDKGGFNIGKQENVSSQLKNPKIQALPDEIINDDPKRNVPPQVIHKGIYIAPLPKKMLLSPTKQMLPKPSTAVRAAVLPSTPNIL